MGFINPAKAEVKPPFSMEVIPTSLYDLCPSSQQKDVTSFYFLLGEAT